MLPARFRFLSIAIVAVLALTVVACAEDNDVAPPPPPANDAPAPPNGEPQTFDVTMTDIAFSETALTVSAGQPAQFSFTNDGALEHDFTIDELDVHVEVPAGQSGETTFTVDQPGEYEFYCSVPGHREAGMMGTLTVD